jgi:hypothetical protein
LVIEAIDQEISITENNGQIIIKVDGQLVTVMSKQVYMSLLQQLNRIVSGEGLEHIENSRRVILR